ncbi:MAG: hypothetical protein FJ216_07605 [Ignavibacteria bacterium]|nr:hypothetical protein [Ignavibacteria bacterium]
MEEIRTNKKNIKSCLEHKTIDDLLEWHSFMRNLKKDILRPDIDYGITPGITKPVLFKPGAEKLRNAFNLEIDSMECVNEICDISKPYIDFTYKCIIKTKRGIKAGICEANANSYEPKFRYTYSYTTKKPTKEESDRAKAAGIGRWKKINDKWIWVEKKENREIIGLKNNIKKIAQKRAFVGAILIATGASEFFTQDMEE